MKLHKKLFTVLSIFLVALTLVACGKGEVVITLAGASDQEVEFKAEFNFFDGVTAKGSDKKDYTSELKLSSISTAVNLETGVLDTTVVGTHKVRYEIKNDDFTFQQWRTVTIKAPEKDDSKLLQNGDFSEGTAHWTIDQGTETHEVKDGAMVIDVTAGGDAYQPRMHQMNIPFEQGKTYEIKFEAKASVAKTINLQVGELLADAPWFTDFKPKQIEMASLTTEYAEYSYKFTHNLDNPRGGVLFEFGKVDGQQIDAIVSIKNITITESTPDADNKAPEFEGIKDREILVGETFDPKAGVTAYDLTDGDVTKDIVVTIKDSEDNVVDGIDSSAVTTFTIVYTVTDKAGNIGTDEMTLTVKEMEFKDENLVVNGDFEAALGEEWKTVANDGSALTKSIVDGKLVVDVTALGANSYSGQVTQEGLTLEKGKTYRVSFKASSSVERDINVAVGVSLVADPWYITYAQVYTVALTATEGSFSYFFTVTEETANNVTLGFEVGNTASGAIGTVTFDDIAINEKEETILINPDFTSEGHKLELSGAAIDATKTSDADSFTVTVNEVGGESYMPHYFYIVETLKAGTYVFKLKVTGSVARHLRFNIVLPDQGFISILDGGYSDFELVVNEAYELEFEFTATSELENVKIELDFGPLKDDGKLLYETETLTGTFVLSDISLLKK
ncbi:MAG: carbohydrate binding domain-containing protein [Acholeplasma sp.]|nr:carbohydrate binding domain-containing protein [Acholeplasma sp.]